jgi:hypothetical protein
VPRLNRSRLSFSSAICAVLAAVLLGAGSGSASTTTDKGVPTWLFDGSATVVTTAAKAQAVARRNDVIIGVPRYGTFLKDLKSANPGVIAAEYHKGTTVKEDFAWVQKNHPDWLLRNQAGNLMKSSWGGYLINPALPAVRQWQIDYALKQQAAGWTAIYMDAMGTMAFYGFPGIPVNPATKRPFTMDEWLNATSGLADAVDKAVSIPVIVNGLNGGTPYKKNTSILATVAQGGVFEGCFRNAMDRVTAWPSLTDWTNQVDAIADVDARGKIGLCMTKMWTGGTTAQLTQWNDFVLASFLLAKGPRSYYMFMSSKTQDAMTSWNANPPAIGAPLGPRVQQGNAWLRKFATGIVAVNPGTGTENVPLGGTYVTPSGTSVTSVSLGAHEGVILTK